MCEGSGSGLALVYLLEASVLLRKIKRTQPTHSAYQTLNLSSGSLKLSRSKGIDFIPSGVATMLAPKSALG